MIRVVVADDQSLLREGFCMILDSQPDIEVIGSVGDGEAALRLLRELPEEQPADVILMDIRMPGMDGITATRHIVERGFAAHSRVLILTTFDTDDHVLEALQAGASGFLVKDAPSGDLIRAVRIVAEGNATLSPSVTRRLLAHLASSRPAPQPVPPTTVLKSLTTREVEVLQLLAQGLSNAEIAERLFVTERTVKAHMSGILMKLGVRDRVQAVVLAYQTGLVTLGSSSDTPGLPWSHGG